MSIDTPTLPGWDRLRHGGLLLDQTRLVKIAAHRPARPLSPYFEKELRKQVAQVQDGTTKPADFVAFILEEVCAFTNGIGTWHRGSGVSADWARPGVTGDPIKPQHLWRGDFGATLAVFIDKESKLGIGRGTKVASQTLQWLRGGRERLAILTNGRQWRLVFAGLDFDAWCQWDIDLWFEDGALAPQVEALRTLFQPSLWVSAKKDQTPALGQAILDSRKGQAELSAVLGERVREAVELLVQAHGDVLKTACAAVDPPDIYRAAVRVVMRLVVVLFAESREKLLPRDNRFYHDAYGLTGLREELDKVASRAGSRLKRSHNAWPRILALFKLVYDGSHHPDLPVPEYGGELFAAGRSDAPDGLSRALAVFETACFDHEMFPDSDVHQMLDLLTKTRVRLRQGRTSTWMPMPVDFSDLSSEYIGILYEGLLDFELKTAPTGDPVIFLAVGNQPALPLSRLEGMDDGAIANLLEKMKDSSGSGEDEEEDAAAEEDADSEAEDDVIEDVDDDATAAVATDADEAEIDTDDRFITRTRAEEWARRAVNVGKLVRKPKGTLTEQKRQAWEQDIARKARQIVSRVVLPGEWYLVRWGGTRKGSGTFYTRPGLAVPTVHRTLRPLAYVPPVGADGEPDPRAPASNWTPQKPEDILALKVCDPACGSGTFPVAALRFLTDAVYAALHHHGRIAPNDAGDRAIVRLLNPAATGDDRLGDELLPCRPTDDTFEPRLKAILRRHVVERCIYGVDLNPLAVELCRLALWIETMDRDLPFSFLDHKVKCGNSLVGAWFDTFRHYPVMAWKNREGGDKSHSNGVHFQKETRTKAIKAFVKETLTPDLQTFLRGRTMFDEDLQERASQTHAKALDVLARLHALPVHAAGERARVYRDEVIGSTEYQSLKSAMDLWCACWFWPVGDIGTAPLPTTLAAPAEATRRVASRVAARKGFFHWELEFPDAFNASRAGFDAILGNPPWDIAKPNSKEFFSNIDPLYRSYGKQEAIAQQTEFFGNPDVELAWLEYNADFRAQSNFTGASVDPFGDPEREGDGGETFNIGRGGASDDFHRRWRDARRPGTGFADSAHPYRHQGSADLNLYKLFLEQAHGLLRAGGRLGFIVPSGLYSDHGTRNLRRLFLDECHWEWLFNFINWESVFPSIYYRVKFNAVIVKKGGKTRSICTAFVRTRLEDWEAAEAFATPYSREQVERFSPRSKAILEIQSTRDLEILEKIYANSVLLGDDSPDGWGITYAREFDMTNDSKLFPPRQKWEAQDYRPDEYSRWLRGDWRPIAELWRELGVDPSKVVPIDADCALRIQAPDVQNTDRPGRLRCAQPPYDTLVLPRADIPAGIILSREADSWIRSEGIGDFALPLYEGRMIGQFDFSEKGWVAGKGRTARWRELPWDRKQIEPQFLMERTVFGDRVPALYAAESKQVRAAFMDVTSATNARTLIASPVPAFPCGNKVPVLNCDDSVVITGLLSSFAVDYEVRRRMSALSLNYFILEELALPFRRHVNIGAQQLALQLGAAHYLFASTWLPIVSADRTSAWRAHWALARSERLRKRCALDAICLALFGLTSDDAVFMLCEDLLTGRINPNGFWRVDQELPAELRQTVLTLAAFADLTARIKATGSDCDRGIWSFVGQNEGSGWPLPSTLCLGDLGIGQDDRAKHPQVVASQLGPRFYDWQLAQSVEESWRECELHAANLAGPSAPGQSVGHLPAAGDSVAALKVVKPRLF